MNDSDYLFDGAIASSDLKKRLQTLPISSDSHETQGGRGIPFRHRAYLYELQLLLKRDELLCALLSCLSGAFHPFGAPRFLVLDRGGNFASGQEKLGVVWSFQFVRSRCNGSGEINLDHFKTMIKQELKSYCQLNLTDVMVMNQHHVEVWYTLRATLMSFSLEKKITARKTWVYWGNASDVLYACTHVSDLPGCDFRCAVRMCTSFLRALHLSVANFQRRYLKNFIRRKASCTKSR